GGIVGVNREIDVETAKELTSTFIEAVIAPSFAAGAREVLARKQNMRVVTADFDAMRNAPTVLPNDVGTEMRTFLGGTLHQEPDRVVEARGPWPADDITVVTKRQPTAEEWTALRFAWRLCAHVRSNTIVFTSSDRSLAIGAGQMTRVDAVKVAVMKSSAG